MDFTLQGYQSSLNSFLAQCLQTKASPADGVDNDCDGAIDEEILNRKDDDDDDLVDEDTKKVDDLMDVYDS